MADGNKERALLLMTNHVQAANAIYKNTGFADANKPEGMKALTYYTVVVHGKALKCIQMEYRIYPCIMRTFFTTFEAEKLRCALYTEPFVSEALLICINKRNNSRWLFPGLLL